MPCVHHRNTAQSCRNTCRERGIGMHNVSVATPDDAQKLPDRIGRGAVAILAQIEYGNTHFQKPRCELGAARERDSALDCLFIKCGEQIAKKHPCSADIGITDHV